MADIVPTPARSIADIPGLKQAGLLVGVAAAVAVAIWLVLWSQGQNYSVLYGQLSERESGQVMDALTAAGIEYKLSPSGAVSVPESKVQEARIRLATQGLPQSDSMGIEMIQKESTLGASSILESARYQSVLETELARTIVKVQGVQSARVHLALPKASVFVRDARKATASVLLQLYPGRRLEPGQVAAIVHLVASSGPELSASDVTLVDQSGTLLNSPDENAEQAASTRQFEYTRKLEESYQQRIIDLLEPIIGPGRVRATVTADMDFTVTEETRENYDPQKTAVRSEQTSTEQRRGGDGTEGIPGALSNEPPGTSGAPSLAGAAAPGNAAPGTAGAAQSTAAGGPSSSAQRSTRNFEVDRTLSYVKQPVGVLKRLNVGVVLDNWQKVGADGKATTAAMSDADIKRFSQLVRESIGLKEDRGDQLNVLNQAFKNSTPLGPVEGPPLWETPWVTQLAKQIVGAGLVLVVAFLVLRPLMKSLTKSVPRLRAGAGTGAGAAGDLDGDRVSISGQGGKAIKLAPSFEQQIAAARTLVGQ